MSNRHEVEGRTIHPRALKELGEEACIVALGVARDLRSGGIPPTDYNQESYCGISCCIAGHMLLRTRSGENPLYICDFRGEDGLLPMGLSNLFCAFHESNPTLAADAIERYVYDGSERPWDTI